MEKQKPNFQKILFIDQSNQNQMKNKQESSQEVKIIAKVATTRPNKTRAKFSACRVYVSK